MRSQLQEALPSVDELLRRAKFAALWQELGPRWSRQVIRAALAEQRERLRQGDTAIEAGEAQAGEKNAAAAARSADRAPRQAPAAGGEAPQPATGQNGQRQGSALEAAIRRLAAARLARSLRPVINATGTILHTNLGRAPLAAEAATRVATLARGYSNLEFDLESGRRGRRDVHVEALACEWTGAERTVVVNNNAAAVLLALNTLAGTPGAAGEVLISRGELVEIGGSFRVPEILARSGARMVEVGTTNRTRIADYRQALTPNTRTILRVHRSNFTMQGFIEQPTLAELVALGRESGVPVLEDLGSGGWLDLSERGQAAPERAAGTARHEPLVAESIAAGVDAVTYSGDKLLGGPQAGLISGNKRSIDPMRANPMFRALRVDRLTYAALETTLRLYALGREREIPVVRMILAHDLEARAQAFAERLGSKWRAKVIAGESVIGGGAAPGQVLPAFLVALDPEGLSANQLEARLRRHEPPVIARIQAGKVVLDLRTVARGEEEALALALKT